MSQEKLWRLGMLLAIAGEFSQRADVFGRMSLGGMESVMNKKSKNGLTLLELVVALGLWLLLSAGVFFLWHHTSGSTSNILRRQSAFERARGAMDMMITGIQMSQRIDLTTNEQNLLDNIIVWGYDHRPAMHNFRFAFFPGIETLRFNSGDGLQSVADNIAAVYIVYTTGRHMNITIYTTCEEPIVIHGSVDVRYKYVVHN